MSVAAVVLAGGRLSSLRQTEATRRLSRRNIRQVHYQSRDRCRLRASRSRYR
jgi:hypothetical protein